MILVDSGVQAFDEAEAAPPAKVKLKVTYTPTGGTPSSQTKTVKLIKDRQPLNLALQSGFRRS